MITMSYQIKTAIMRLELFKRIKWKLWSQKYNNSMEKNHEWAQHHIKKQWRPEDSAMMYPRVKEKKPPKNLIHSKPIFQKGR